MEVALNYQIHSQLFMPVSVIQIVRTIQVYLDYQSQSYRISKYIHIRSTYKADKFEEKSQESLPV